MIPDQNVQLISEVNDEVFSAFGINIDKTALERAQLRQIGKQEQVQRQVEKA